MPSFFRIRPTRQPIHLESASPFVYRSGVALTSAAIYTAAPGQAFGYAATIYAPVITIRDLVSRLQAQGLWVIIVWSNGSVER